MKNLSYLFLLLFITSCGESNLGENEERLIELDTSSQDTLDIHEKVDSFLWIGPQKFLVEVASDTHIFQGKKTSAWEDEDSVITYYPEVSRYGDSLILKPENGEMIVLENIPMENDSDFESANYYFQGDVPNSNYWEVFSIGYEYHWYVLVNKTTGDTTLTRGPAAFSETRKYVMTGNPDLEAAFTYNGLELFETKSEELIVIGKMEIPDWGPFSIKWISDSQVLITSGKIDYNQNYSLSYKNVILTMVDNE